MQECITTVLIASYLKATEFVPHVCLQLLLGNHQTVDGQGDTGYVYDLATVRRDG